MLTNKKLLAFITILNCQALLAIPEFANRIAGIVLADASSYLILKTDIGSINGTIQLPDEAPGRVSGGKLLFNHGTLGIGVKDLVVTGTYDQTANDRIYLQNQDIIILPSGQSVNKEIYVSSGASASILGSPVLLKPITLENSTSTLNLGLQSQLSQNINLNGGKIVLMDDLNIKVGTQITGNGTIDVGGKILNIPRGEFATGKLSFLDVDDIAFYGNVLQTTEYVFSGVNGTSCINGNGYSWTFEGNGFTTVGPSHKIFFSDNYFKGLGHYPSHGYFNIDPTGTVVFQACSFVLDTNYTHSSGTLMFLNGCRIIPHGFSINVTGSGYVCVDGTSLYYDALGGADANPFSFSSEATQKQLLNNGVIRSSAQNPPILISATSATINLDHNLSSQSVLSVTNPIPASPRSVSIDFNYHTLTFLRSGSGLLALDPNVNLTVSNVELFEFNKNCVSYGDASATLSFGAGTKIRLLDTESITGGDKAWNFTGTGLVSGAGTALNLTGSARITVTNSSTLTFKDLKITIGTIDAIKALDAGSKIVFQNCSVIVQFPGFDISAGHVDIDGMTDFRGTNTFDSADGVSPFSFSSSGTFTVKSGATMKLGKNIEFFYKANPSTNLGKTYYSKRHFVLQDATATLELDGCILHSTFTGLAIDYGKIIVSDNSKFIIDGSSGTQAEVGSALDVYIKPSISFSVTGTLAYNSTTLP